MPQVSIFSLRFSKLSIFFTYLSVNHTRDDLAERADPRVHRKEVLSRKSTLTAWRKEKPQQNGIEKMLSLSGIAGGTRRTG